VSGITPLLDTLLHQVLGKRVDTAPPRDLTEPVRPVDSGDGPRALHSDSRLDGRRPALAPLPGTATPGQRGEGMAPRTDAPLPPASTQTHFSPSARTIADLLVRFPAPPSVLSTTAPLMQAGEAPSVPTLADRLQSGIRDSGLFYESHLSRWYRGEVSRQQLEREPQMLRTLRFTPAAVVQGSASLPGAAATAQQAAPSQPTAGQAPLATAPPAPGQATPGQLAAAQGQAPQGVHSYTATEALFPAPGAGLRPAAEAVGGNAGQGREPAAPSAAARAEGPEAALREGSEQPVRARPAGGEPVHESLQGVVRHQLEMLVSPVLRWEGDVWSGIFMALMIHMPAGARRDGEESAQDEHDSSQEAWHSELQLTVPSLGDIHVALWLQEQNVRLQLQSRDEAALETLLAGIPRLEQRLLAAGLTTVLIDARPWEEGGANDGTQA
jgi:flagellar biosynthesis protein